MLTLALYPDPVSVLWRGSIPRWRKCIQRGEIQLFELRKYFPGHGDGLLAGAIRPEAERQNGGAPVRISRELDVFTARVLRAFPGEVEIGDVAIRQLLLSVDGTNYGFR